MQRKLPAERAWCILQGWVEAEAGRFILFLPIFLAGGIAVYFALPAEPPAAIAIIMAALLSAAAWGVCTRLGGMPSAALLCAGVAALGFACAQREVARTPPWEAMPRHAVAVTSRVAAVEMLPAGRRITLAAPSLDGEAAMTRSLRIRLRASDTTALVPGDMITVRALVRPPPPPAYPGAWDSQRDAFFADLNGFGFAIGPSAVIGAPVQASGLRALRESIAARIERAMPGTRGAIAATLLTGLGSAIPTADRSAFQDSGLAHLLAVAGLHIGIVMGLAYGAMRRALALSEHAALRWPCKRIAGVACLAAGFFYLALTGAHVPILRSFAMACLVTLALLTGRRAASLRSLAVAATVLMLAAPNLVMGVSFQMSFAAVLALVAGWEAIAPWMAKLGGEAWWGWPAGHAASALAASVLAGTASLPVAAYHFGSATLYYVPANLLAVPLTAFWVMPWGLLALGLMPVGLERLALVPMGWGIGLVDGTARAVASWPNARLPLGQLPAASLLLMVAGLVWLCLWRTRVRFAGLPAMVIGLGVAWAAPAPDILVGDGARLVAVRLGGKVFVSTAHGVSRFDRDAPSRLWGVASVASLPADGVAGDGAIACAAGTCRIAVRGQVAVLVGGEGGCPPASVLVSHAKIVCPGRNVLDMTEIAWRGAAVVRLTQAGALVRAVADGRARPWAIEGNAIRLPPALIE